MVARIEAISLALLDEAIQIWERDGWVTPATFVMGHSRVIFAQPYEERGLHLPREARTAMDALLISAVDAVYLGRIEESYIQERHINDPAPDDGELERLADFDPSITTALSVQAINTRTRRAVVAIARHALDDEGRHDWTIGIYDHAEGESVVAAVESCAMARGIENPLPDYELRAEILALGWETMDSDNIEVEVEEES